MGEHREAFVGIHVPKGRNDITDGERGARCGISASRCLAGEHDPDRAAPGEKYNRVQFCYEAGPTGYGLYRLITALGHDCAVSRHR